MEDNKNLILGSIAIIVVVLVALILFLPKDGRNEAKTEIDNVKVYIHHEKTEDKEGYYSECKLSTEDLVKVRNDYDKMHLISMDNLVTNKSINGDYKVVVDDSFIAFDKEHDNTFYLSGNDSLYTYKSDIYDLIIKDCGSLDS